MSPNFSVGSSDAIACLALFPRCGAELSTVVVNIPTPYDPFPLSLEPGRSTIFVGANGAGKTRLGVFLEDRLPADRVHRIAAHRHLSMSDAISSISFDRAMKGLQFGSTEADMASPEPYRRSGRWRSHPAVALLSDFEFLLQALFSEQSRTAVTHLEAHRADRSRTPPETVLSRLKDIWERLLPHRKLRLLELGIEVSSGSSEGQDYKGSEMSDGERVIFYLLGQCLLAPGGCALIIDEPELHIHKAILGRLWDAIEAERPDCSFVFITHDLDFVVARPTAKKFVVKAYHSEPRWELEALPEGTGLPERVISELVGSRQPVLFVEGTRGSLDTTIYRSVFSEFLVEPIGSCEAVIHAVSTFRSNNDLHRLGDVCGCVDGDAREADEVAHLRSKGVYVLPVAEIENALLLPPVYRELAKALEFHGEELAAQEASLLSEVMALARCDLESASVRFAVRRLDAALKKLAPRAKTVEDLSSRFDAAVKQVDVRSVAESYRQKLEGAISDRHLLAVLALYDNKGLLNIGARQLGLRGRDELAEFTGRLLGGKRGAGLRSALREVLPEVAAA
jgi:hypothetical protein